MATPNIDIPMSDKKIAQLLGSPSTETGGAFGELIKRTAVINFPAMFENVTTTTNSVETRGVLFASTVSSTVTEVRAKINASNGATYRIGIYEVGPDMITITAVKGVATHTATASTTGSVLTIPLAANLTAGKYYVLAASGPNMAIYYTGDGQPYSSVITASPFIGAISPGRSVGTTTPGVGTVFSRGSDVFTVGFTAQF